MLAIKVSLASKIYSWPRRWIHRTTIPETLGRLSHHRCMHHSKKSAVQCDMWKNASDRRKCPKDNNTWQTTVKYQQHTQLHWWSIIHSNACYEGRITFYSREQSWKSNIQQRHVSQHSFFLKREHLINENLLWENQKRRCFDYAPNQKSSKRDGIQTN